MSVDSYDWPMQRLHLLSRRLNQLHEEIALVVAEARHSWLITHGVGFDERIAMLMRIEKMKHHALAGHEQLAKAVGELVEIEQLKEEK